MPLSEYEQRILRDLEGSLRDCEPRFAAIERRVQRRHRRLLLIILCSLAPLAGIGMIVLGALTGGGGLVLAVFGSVLLAAPCLGVGPLWTSRTADRPRRETPRPGAELP